MPESTRRRARYTITIIDRKHGGRVRLNVSLRTALLSVGSVLALPLLVGLGLKWGARAEIAQLRAHAEVLEVENRSYRAATGALAAQIQELQSTMTSLGERAQLDAAAAKAMEKLPAQVKAQAVGGPFALTSRPLFVPSLNPPDDTFGVLRDLLHSIENRLRLVQVGVERREALAAATPTIWPAHGWLTDVFGRRSDPFTGEPAFHHGLDISTSEGQPVYATAYGSVRSAGRAGAYGNMVVIDHGFGLQTRYAHLQRFTVKAGDRVKRGDIIGYVGTTGRATGSHVHYEIVANGRMLNPLKFLIDRARP
ncbi:MAG TPA: M23 family metallopeptidase [Vicinamibacterales bacterium]|nr:M23 family metallopeptidase [Vicinamibacterales bacterium]